MNNLIIYSLIIVALFLISCVRVNQMFYYPDRIVYATPADQGLHFEEVVFSSRDGTELSGWFIPAVGEAQGTILHLHGNAENMTSHFGFVSWLPAAGFNLLVFDYRGYGQSAGRPHRGGVYEDSCAALAYLRSRADIDPTRLLILGQSLGGAQAVTVVGGGERAGVRAVVVESSFYSYRSIVRDSIGKMPLLSWVKTPLAHILISDELSPADYVDKIAPIPLLLIHGTQDEIIPFRHAELLLERAGEPKTLWRIEGGHHTPAFAAPDSPYRRQLVEFFAAALARN
ncbi:MAG: alpha/beta hydrolase [Desulfuromonadales bacterium]|nr:alpha/beta hydrolase [Desulfuromonadales bacterium]